MEWGELEVGTGVFVELHLAVKLFSVGRGCGTCFEEGKFNGLIYHCKNRTAKFVLCLYYLELVSIISVLS